MTDPNAPTDLSEVVAIGQRARGPSPFAALQWPTKGLGIPAEQLTDVPDDGTGVGPGAPSDEEIQCALPEGRKVWNRDARAVSAVAEPRLAANQRHGEIDFASREYGALLYEFPDGRIELGTISDGPYVGPPTGGQGSVGIPPAGCHGGIPVGYIHTHPSSSPVPSPADMNFLRQLVDHYGAPANASVYIVGNYAQQPYGAGTNHVSAATLADKDAVEQPGYVPKWVNPEAKPCPGTPQ